MKKKKIKKYILHVMLLWGISISIVAQNTATITMDFKADFMNEEFKNLQVDWEYFNIKSKTTFLFCQLD